MLTMRCNLSALTPFDRDYLAKEDPELLTLLAQLPSDANSRRLARRAAAMLKGGGGDESAHLARIAKLEQDLSEGLIARFDDGSALFLGGYAGGAHKDAAKFKPFPADLLLMHENEGVDLRTLVYVPESRVNEADATIVELQVKVTDLEAATSTLRAELDSATTPVSADEES